MQFIRRRFEPSVFFTALFITNAWSADENTNILVQPISTVKKIFDLIVEGVVKYSFQVLAGVLILSVGWIIAKFVTDFVQKFLQKKSMDVTISKFIILGIKMVILGLII